MDRINEMKKFLYNIEESLRKEWISKIKRICMNDKMIKEEIVNIVKELTAGRETGCIVLSFLRSSYITGSHELYIAYYSDDPFVEEEPDNRYYGLHSFFEGIEKILQCMNKELENKYIRILASEKEEIRRWFMCNIYMQLGSAFKMIFEDIQSQESLYVFYGNYLGELDILGKI